MLWDWVPRLCRGGGGCALCRRRCGGVPLGAVPVLSWCRGEVSCLSGVYNDTIIIIIQEGSGGGGAYIAQ